MDTIANRGHIAVQFVATCEDCGGQTTAEEASSADAIINLRLQGWGTRADL